MNHLTKTIVVNGTPWIIFDVDEKGFYVQKIDDPGVHNYFTHDEIDSRKKVIKTLFEAPKPGT